MLETLFILSGLALTMALFLDFPKEIMVTFVQISYNKIFGQERNSSPSAQDSRVFFKHRRY
ncbi:MAG: hypothetical protein SFU91_04615 [Chloroherpetonaceae bacterium]|nr:hypothetical protein [Chloroherpetonaceae bacterium]